MGLVQYSPELKLWRRRKNRWQLVLHRKQGHPVKAKYINCLAWACQVLNPLGAMLFQINRALQDATMRYMALKPQHALLRSDFLQSKLHDPTLSKDHHSAISRLVSLEVLRNSYRRIRAIKQQSLGRSITAVKYSSPSGTVLATSRSDVEAALSHTLQACFKGAHGSPFLHAPLAPLVGLLGTGPAARAILEGTFHCPQGVDEYTRLFIEALQFPSPEIHYSRVSALL